MLNCEYYDKAYKQKHCAFDCVCTEENCIFATKKHIQELQNTVDNLENELVSNELSIIDLEDKTQKYINEIEDEIQNYIEENEKLTKQVESLIEYIKNTYNPNFDLDRDLT